MEEMVSLVFTWEGTISRVMAADRPYGKFYDFHSVRPEYLFWIHSRIILSHI
jgi:hypothetical protein